MSESEHLTPRIGCADIPGGIHRDRYLSRLDFLELARSFYQLPKPSALRKRARDARTGFGLGLVAWQLITHRPGPRGYKRMTEQLTGAQLAEAGGFADTPVVRGAVDRLVEAVEAAGAETVLFRSPPDLSPSTANRDRLRHFFAEVAPAERFGSAVRVWEPQGLWEPRTAIRLAGELELVLAIDPMAADPVSDEPLPLDELPGGMAYLRLGGLGHTGPLRAEQLEALAEISELYSRCWYVFATSDAFRDATGLRKLLGPPTDSDDDADAGPESND